MSLFAIDNLKRYIPYFDEFKKRHESSVLTKMNDYHNNVEQYLEVCFNFCVTLFYCVIYVFV